MRKLTNLEQCEYAFKIIEALWEMSERRNKRFRNNNNTRFTGYRNKFVKNFV